LINGSVCSGVYHDVWRKLDDRLLNQISTQDVDIWAGAAADLDIAASSCRFTK